MEIGEEGKVEREWCRKCQGGYEVETAPFEVVFLQSQRGKRREKNKYRISVRNPGNCTEWISTPDTRQG